MSMSGPPPLTDRLRGAAQRIATERGTPFYLYDFEAIERRTRELRAALPERFELCYAVKANPSLAVLTLLKHLGLGADVASAGEVLAVRKAGFEPRRVFMTGPAKSDRDLNAALDADVAGINVEGPHELDRLERLAAARGVRVAVQLRLQPNWSAGEGVRIIGGGGGWSKFGLMVADARRLLSARDRWAHLDIGGFQVFDSSNVLEAARIVEQVERVIALSLDLSGECGMPLRAIDFGGGFGVPYAENDPRLDLTELRTGLQRLLSEFGDRPELAATRLIFEPGRYLVAEAGVYACRVIDVKPSGERTILLVDGGIHHFMRPVLIGTPHPVWLLGGDADQRPRREVVIAGPLCTGHDLLHPQALLPNAEPGDLLLFGQCGAYGFTEAMHLFLSHEPPAEYGLRGDHLAPLRNAPTIAEHLERQATPSDLTTPTGCRE